MKSKAAAELAEKEMGAEGGRGAMMLESVSVPPPVFFCSVEPATAALQKGSLVLDITRIITNTLLMFVIRSGLCTVLSESRGPQSTSVSEPGHWSDSAVGNG